MEVIGKLIEKRKFVNRGFLIGPYCPIYGHGAILITILLQKYIDDPIALFIMGVVVCSILEYLTSYFMEKIFHARWWDYSRYKFNINDSIWTIRTFYYVCVKSILFQHNRENSWKYTKYNMYRINANLSS